MATGDIYDVNSAKGSMSLAEDQGWAIGSGGEGVSEAPSPSNKLSNTQAQGIATGLQATTTLGSGIASAAQMGKLSDQAYLQGIGDIEKYEKEQKKRQQASLKAEEFKNKQLDFQDYQNKAALRQTKLQRELTSLMEKAKNRRQSAKDIARGVLDNENFRDALVQMRGM